MTRNPNRSAPARATPPALALALATALAILPGCGGGDQAGGATAGGGGRAGGAGDGPGGPRAGRAAAVEVAVAAEGSIGRSLTVSGIVEPIRAVGINSQLAGALTSVEAEEGDRVVAGQVLARLDDRELRAQAAAAEAAYQVAEAAYERARQLRERKVITLPEFERDRTAFTAAEAQRELADTRLEYATIESPIAGVVTEKRVEAGDVVGAQSRLFTVADVSTMVVRVQVSELDVAGLEAGDGVAVALDAFPGRSFRGRIRRVFPAADPETRLVPVEVALLGAAAELARPGFLARATFTLGLKEGVLLVPAGAVVGNGPTTAVFVVEDGSARRRSVTTGVTSQGRIEIVSGLAAGETVVTAGSGTLQDGAPVRVVGEGRREP